MTKFQPPPRVSKSKSRTCQVCEMPLSGDARYTAQPCGHGPFCYGCTEKLKMRPSKPVCKECKKDPQRFIRSFEECHHREQEALVTSSEMPTLLPFTNDDAVPHSRNDDHEYLSGQARGDIYRMTNGELRNSGDDSRKGEADDDHKELEVKVGGAPSLVETPQGLFAPDELNKNSTADDGCEPPTEAVDDVSVGEDPLLGIVRDPSMLLDVGLSIELGKTKAIALFKEKRFLESVEMLTRCINSHVQAESSNTALRSILHSNRALAVLSYIKTAAVKDDSDTTDALYRIVVEDCDSASHFDRDNTKAMYRRALAFNELDDLDRSLEDISRVLTVFSSRDESHPQAVALKEAVMTKRKALEKKWGVKGPISVSRLWNKPTGRPPADETPTWPASIQTSKLVTMPVAAPNVVTEDRSEGSGVFEKKKRSNDGICKAVFKASTLERELRRLKSKGDCLVNFIAHELTPSKLKAVGVGPAGLSALDPDCAGAMLQGLCEAARREEIDEYLLCEYIETMSSTRMISPMVIMMLDQSERKCLNELGSYIVDVDDPIAIRARSILEDWHGNGV